ncbi:MAG: HmuY family protein [Candidatus Marinimicrobia bacterium]|nr:HmuY family protein [Candidatus Neomarinimicrobiota bacterium]MBL7059719.1 HmuY family protein [Candidatus Neomarinimicrobiota bacterium]
MKALWITLLGVMLLAVACEEENNDDILEYNTYSTINVKTEGSEYFTFSTNSGVTDSSGLYDLEFYSVSYTPPGAPFPINDPRIGAGENITIAAVNAGSLEMVSEVPDAESFVSGFTTETDAWYYMTDSHMVLPNDYVYVVNTADGKFPAFEVTNYYDDQGNSGSFTIQWKYLSN